MIAGFIPFSSVSCPTADILTGRAFRQCLLPGAFDACLDAVRAGAVVVPLLVEHDWGRRLADTSAPDVKVWADGTGLRWACRGAVAAAVLATGLRECSLTAGGLVEAVVPGHDGVPVRFSGAGSGLVEISVVGRGAFDGTAVFEPDLFGFVRAKGADPGRLSPGDFAEWERIFTAGGHLPPADLWDR